MLESNTGISKRGTRTSASILLFEMATGCWHPITAYNSAFIYSATNCGGFYSSFLRIFKLPRSICWLFCKIPIIFGGGDLMIWSLEYHVVWHWWPLANLPRMNLISPRPDFLHPHSWCAMVWAGTITTLLFWLCSKHEKATSINTSSLNGPIMNFLILSQ